MIYLSQLDLEAIVAALESFGLHAAAKSYKCPPRWFPFDASTARQIARNLERWIVGHPGHTGSVRASMLATDLCTLAAPSSLVGAHR